jgi:hypothetical protein
VGNADLRLRSRLRSGRVATGEISLFANSTKMCGPTCHACPNLCLVVPGFASGERLHCTICICTSRASARFSLIATESRSSLVETTIWLPARAI